MAILGEGFIALKPETTKFGGLVTDALAKIGPVGGAVAGIAGIGLAVSGTLLKVGESYETAFNNIIKKTGATGDTLKGLEETTKQVFGNSAISIGGASDAVALLYAKTGLTGTALQDLAGKMATLSRITKTDVNADIQATNGIFTQFGVAAKDQSGSLDTLYKASQVAGVGFDQFTGALTTAAPTAKTLGLNVGQASALVAQLTKIGLPASKVMQGLGAEFAKAAKAGENPTDVIGRMIAQIKKAPDSTKAAGIAIADFGLNARSAATFVSAARSGVFDFGDTLGKITNGQGGIKATGKDVATIGSNMKVFSHQIENLIQPAATVFLGKLNDGVFAMTGYLKTLLPYVKQVTDVLFKGDFKAGPFSEDSPVIDVLFRIRDGFKDVFGYLVAHKSEVIGALVAVGLIAVEAFGSWAIAAGLAAAASLIAAAPAIALVAALAALGAGAVYAYQHFTVFREVVDAVGRFFRDRFIPDLRIAFEIIKDVVGGAINFLSGLWRRFGSDLTAIGSTMLAQLTDIFRVAFRVIGDLVEFFKNVFTGKWSDAFHNILDIISALGGLAIRSLERMFQLAGEAGHFLLDAIVGLGPGLLKAVGELVVLAGKAFVGLNLFFLHAGEDLVKGMIQGIGNQAGNLLSTIKDSVVDAPVNLAKSLLHISSPSLVFADIGHNIMAGLAQGISGNQTAALEALRQVPLGIPGASAASGGTGGSNQLVQLLQAIRANTDPTHPEQQATKQLLVGIKSNTDMARGVVGAPSTSGVASAVAFKVSR